MASLKEIKGRIASVKSTVKVTSAMKMVASAKLRVAQKRIGNMVPYESMLRGILVGIMKDPSSGGVIAGDSLSAAREPLRNVALVCFSSNSSLCGGFNANAIRLASSVIDEYKAAGIGLIVYSVGRKMAAALKKKGYPSPVDYTAMAGKPEYDGAAALAKELVDGFSSGRFDKVELIYNHYKSNSSQPTVRETYLPLSLEDSVSAMSELAKKAHRSEDGPAPEAPSISASADYIFEPGKEELMKILLPKVVMLKIYTVLLDTNAAEHAARTMAMQMATDNGNDLLSDLTLQYNKGRQQKITTELLDIAGGSMQ